MCETMAKKRDISHLPAEDQARIEAKREYDRNAKKKAYAATPEVFAARRDAWRTNNPDKQNTLARRNTADRRAKLISEDRESFLESQREAYANNREARIKSTSDWIKRNQPKVNAYVRKKRESDTVYQLAGALRSRIRSAVKADETKAGSAVRDLGCMVEELRAHLESQFRHGMSWDNYGKGGWEIDHIIPLASFDLTDREQFLKACHYTNLQPLWHHENRAKGDKLVVDGEMIRGRDLKAQGHKPENNDNNDELKTNVS